MATPIDVALAIAAAGLPVFPCGKTKKPSISKKNGGHGFHDAIVDAAQIRALFGQTNAYLVGVPTGEPSGFDVLDFDYRHGASAWEAANAHRIPPTRSHRTMSGGKHLLFRHAPGVRNLASKFADGMDVRGDGGYIIHPPSTGYTVDQDVPVAEWPQWLLEIVLAPPPAKPETAPHVPVDLDSKRLDGFVKAVLDKVRAAGEGQKHFTLRNAALSLGGVQSAAGLSDGYLISALCDALPKTVKDWNGAKATIEWGLANGRKRPVVLPDRDHHAKLNGNSRADPRPEPPPFDGFDPNSPFAAPAPAASPRPITVYAGERHKAADAGLAALVAAGEAFYQRDKSMVRAAVCKAKSSDGRIVSVPGIVPVTLPMLARALGQATRWERPNKKGALIRIDPPKEVVEQIGAMVGHWPFPPLAGVIGTQTIRPDGTLLLSEGYDEATGLYLMAPPQLPPVPDRPERKHAETALALLADLLSEFPFSDKTSHSVAISMMMTPVLRGALAPAVPMHVVTAPQPGTGKSYLQDTASVIATGECCAVIALAPKEDETEKRLISAALGGFPIIAIDNVNGILTGTFLAQVTERPIMLLRPLGGSPNVRIPNVFTVFANGNNLTATADLVRRTLRCSLDSDLENPEDRQFSRNPVAMIMEDRGKYVAACLVIARAYLASGSPDKRPRLPSFGAWSDLVRSALVWLGCADPVASMDLSRADDPTRQARTAMFDAWATEIGIDGIGITTGEIVEYANSFDSRGFVRPALRAACMTIARDRAGTGIQADRLGQWLRKAANNRAAGYKLLVDRRDEKRPKWLLETGHHMEMEV